MVLSKGAAARPSVSRCPHCCALHVEVGGSKVQFSQGKSAYQKAAAAYLEMRGFPPFGAGTVIRRLLCVAAAPRLCASTWLNTPAPQEQHPSHARETLFIFISLLLVPFRPAKKRKKIINKNSWGKCLLYSSAHCRSSCAGVCLLSLHPSLRRAPSEGCKIGENCCVMLR